MSVLEIGTSSLFSYLTQNVQSKRQQFQQEFQQLGQDLESGNLSAAQSDFATLQRNMPGGSSGATASTSSSSQSTNPLTQAFRGSHSRIALRCEGLVWKRSSGLGHWA